MRIVTSTAIGEVFLATEVFFYANREGLTVAAPALVINKPLICWSVRAL